MAEENSRRIYVGEKYCTITGPAEPTEDGWYSLYCDWVNKHGVFGEVDFLLKITTLMYGDRVVWDGNDCYELSELNTRIRNPVWQRIIWKSNEPE